MQLRKGRSILEPKKPIRFATKPRFHFRRKARTRKGKTTFTPNGGVPTKQQKILVSMQKPSKVYIKNPKKQTQAELKELLKD